jgi:hypothetical protein
MGLAGRLEPEQWSAIMKRFFAILSEGVERFEGYVDKFTGDGIMALFGAPIAHEDHARRACYAALYLQDVLRTYATELRLRHGLNFSVRIGVNSGEVIRASSVPATRCRSSRRHWHAPARATGKSWALSPTPASARAGFATNSWNAAGRAA